MIPLGQTKNMDIFLLMPAPGQWDKFIAETAAGVGARECMTQAEWAAFKQLLWNSFFLPILKNENCAIQM